MIGKVAGRTDIDNLTEELSRLCLIDVGRISSYSSKTGKGDVELYMIRQGERQVLANIEIVSIGNGVNGILSNVVGSPCLVFFPRTAVPSLRDGLTKIDGRMYDYNGAKAIPLATLQDVPVQVGFTGLGQFVIQNENFVLGFDKSGITLQDGAGTTAYSFTNEVGIHKYEGSGKIINNVLPSGEIEMQYKNDDGKIAYRMNYNPTTGTYTVQRGAFNLLSPEQEDEPSTYELYRWTTIYDGTTGNITETLQTTPDGDTKKILWTKTMNADGSVSFVQTNTDGDVLNNIAISASGDISISQTKAENSITLKQDGTCNVTTKGKTTVKSAGLEMNGDSGKVTVKNAQASLFTDVLKALVDLLNGSAGSVKTAGSPGSQTVVPGQFTSIATKLGLLME